jgi:outer membrane immunogenic protein
MTPSLIGSGRRQAAGAGASMKKFLVAGIATAAFCAAPALAADMPVKEPVVAAPFSWNGCYGGVEGGGIWGRTRYVATRAGVSADVGLTQFMADPDGGTIGGTLGCNVQTSNWVWGIENDFGWAHISKNHAQIPPFDTTGSGRTSTNWLDTLRGRAGIAVDRSLWYVTGGVAFTDVKSVMTTSLSGAIASITHDRTGWVIGAGVEWVLADPRWSFKAEYLYADFGKKNYDFQSQSLAFANSRISLTENIFRVGLNYRFGDPWGTAPVSTKY